MKKIIQSSLLVLALFIGFVSCNEDTPDINDPGVEKRLKKVTSSDDFSSIAVKNFIYENDKIVNMNGYFVERASGDTVYFNQDISYSGNMSEIILSNKDQYTGGVWVVEGKYICEIDANNNIVSIEYLYFESGVFELIYNREFEYLSTGQLKSYIEFNGGDVEDRYEDIFEFNANNLLQSLNIVDYEGDTSLYTYTNNGINVVNGSNIIDTDDYYYENEVNYSYDSNNRLNRENYSVYERLRVNPGEPDWSVRDSFTVITNYSYDADGLLSSTIRTSTEAFSSEVGDDIFEYEAGYGNIQTFWFLPFDYGGPNIDWEIHKALNKGIATVQ